jgi:hypothetical protein
MKRKDTNKIIIIKRIVMLVTRTLLSDKEKDEHMIWVLYPLIPIMIFIWCPLWFTSNCSSSRVRNYSNCFSLQLKININRKAYEYWKNTIWKCCCSWTSLIRITIYYVSFVGKGAGKLPCAHFYILRWKSHFNYNCNWDKPFIFRSLVYSIEIVILTS